MLDWVKSFLFEYFWLPIIDESVYYNIYNTTAYALLFAILTIYVLFPTLKKIGLSLNKNFFIAISPFVFIGGFARSLKDLDILNTILLETPIIYILLFSIALLTLFTSKKLEQKSNKYPYWKSALIVGLTLLITILGTIITNSTINQGIILEFILLFLTSSTLLSAVIYAFNSNYFNYKFLIPVIGHLADASSTITSLNHGGEEKHVLASYFIQIMGPYGMYIMKTLAIIPITYFIINEYEGEKRNYYLFIVATLGIALATRNITSIALS